MADEADKAAELSERERQDIARQRVSPRSMKGPVRCLWCGWPNDRATLGYSVCSDCWEEAE